MTWITSGIPQIIDRLVGWCSERPELVDAGVLVVDGLGNVNDLGDYLHVGVDNPFGSGQVAAASSDQNWAGATPSIRREDEGSVTCTVVSNNPDGNQKAARDRVFMVAGVVQQMLREYIRLDPPGFEPINGLIKTSFGGLEYDQDNDQEGALAVLVFRSGFQMNLSETE